MKINLVDDWRNAWKWISVRSMVVAAAIQGTWIFIPEDMRDAIPHGIVSGLTIGLLALGIAGRLIKQGDANVANNP